MTRHGFIALAVGLAATLPAGAGEEKDAGAPAPPAAEKTADPARIDGLLKQLGSTDGYDAREAAKQELLAAGAAAEPGLLAALGDPSPRVRRSACEILGRMRSAAAAPRLAERLADADPDLREAAAAALERIGTPAREAVTKAREAGTLPAAEAEAFLDREIKRKVESLLDGCISKDLGYGFYKDQFKGLVALGPPATRILLRLFTTSEADYAFSHTFDDEANEVRVRYRKQIIQRLAGEALLDMKDPSVIAPLKAFLASLGEVNPLDDRDPRQDYQEATAFVLMRLGDAEAYQTLKNFLLKASGATAGADGRLEVKLSDDLKKSQQQFTALTRLAMLQIKADDLAATERTYQTIIALAVGRQDEAGIRVFDKDKDGKLNDKERKAMNDTVDAILRRSFAGPVTPDLEKFWREYVFHRGVLRGAYYNFACALAQMDNRKAEALDALLKAVRAGYEDADWIQRDRDLDSIKEEPEYKRLIQDLQRRKQREEERGG